ncbi:DUF3290 domain-containing protein [uncultured Selenomonas sp.]|uniref:DUF3290 domain-containing protein n=1 Tax=uncultured Selenomonas sp. TaxID=159275 RepID=UPI0028DD1A15|nr:DUF3290 domain-containing protein [uncultured Selenomonas sp.]
MQFYTYDYIVQRSQFNDIALYVLSFLALIALLFTTFKYFRNRLVTRYRDLIVIFVLAVAFLGGTQWNSFNQTKADSEQTSRMAGFLHTLGEEMQTPPEEIHTNSTHLKQGMLVEVQGKYYEILFNSDFTSFKYEETHLMTRDVKVVDKDS